MRLGKTPAREDARTLRMAKYLVGPVTIPPPDADWSSPVNNWRMFGNDVVGCCTRAAQGHAIQTWEAPKDVAPSDTSILSAYSAISGYDPGVPATDRGANMLDALNDWRKVGLDGHRIHGYVKLDAGDRSHVMATIQMFGGIYVGAQLPRATQGRDVWIASSRLSRPEEYLPGSWGGHTFWVAGYSQAGIVVVSWGRLFHASWQWWIDYVDEAYAVLGQDWADEGRPAPSGLDLSALRADLSALGA